MLKQSGGWLGLLLLFMSSSGFAIDPRLDWFTVESDHFRLHFADGYEKNARKILPLAEAVHKKLVPQFAWQPVEKTELVLSDESDTPNGYVNPFPYNRTVLWLAAPDQANSLEDYRHWLERLLVHEYTHVLHLDRVAGAPNFLRSIFGRHELLFPNRLQPAWFTEGLATWMETNAEQGVGRGQSSYYSMLMRLEVEQGIKPLSQVNLPIRSWPAGTSRYLYGVHFFQFIEQKYGVKVIQKWLALYSQNLVPFKINATAKKLFGKDLTVLWAEFETYLQQRYQPQAEAIKKSMLVKGERLTLGGGYTRQLRAAAKGVYYLRENDFQPAALMHWSVGGGERLIRRVNRGSRLDWHPTAGILLMQPEICDEYARYFDLYRIDPTSGEQRRLTHCQRYRPAAWSPQGDQIVAVQLQGEVNRLVLLDSEGQNPELLWQAEGAVIGGLDWSPDGERLLASVQRAGVGWNLEWFDLSSRRWSALSTDEEIETEPQFSLDGKSLLFSSEHGGVYNLRRLHLVSGEVETVTNLLGGGFSPSESADGSLYYSAYGENGFDLFQLQQPTALPQAAVVNLRSGVSATEPLSSQMSLAAVKPYSPLNTLKPRWWFPQWLFTDQRSEVGFSTSASDAVDRHCYDFSLLMDLNESNVSGSLAYGYQNWLSLSVARDYQLEFDPQGQLQRLPVDRLNLTLNHPWSQLRSRWNALLGVSSRWQSGERENALGVALLFNNSSRQLRSVSRNDGRKVRLLAESEAVLGGDRQGEAFLLDWREYVRLGDQQVLALRYLQGLAQSGAKPFRLGGEGSFSLLTLSASDGLFNRRSYALRGYAEGLLQLRGEEVRLLSAEWRFPLRRIERGIMVPPVGVQQLSGLLFAEAGAAWSGVEVPNYHRTLGAELNADLNLFYGLDFRLRLGLAEGLDEGGETRAYLALDSAF